MPSRNGKIARLPRALREQLNQRLDDDQDGPEILDWLNALPETQALLREHFQGISVSKQNLSEWRLGGFAEWLLRRDLQAHVQGLLEAGQDIQENQTPARVVDAVALVLAARFGALLTHWNGEVDEQVQARARLLIEVSRSVVNLQRSVHHAVRECAQEKERVYEQEKKEKSDRCARRMTALVGLEAENRFCQNAGNTPEARRYARAMTEILTDTFDYRNYTRDESDPVKPSQTATPAAAATP
jgi:hypothetical protein